MHCAPLACPVLTGSRSFADGSEPYCVRSTKRVVLEPQAHADFIDGSELMCESAYFDQQFVFFAWPPRVTSGALHSARAGVCVARPRVSARSRGVRPHVELRHCVHV